MRKYGSGQVPCVGLMQGTGPPVPPPPPNTARKSRHQKLTATPEVQGSLSPEDSCVSCLN
ncbi:hypothetical protein E4U21_002017 [Claviceps maximensis]|nr:hypothetical protein E4U21_002017 [Claviceps maximensis]